MENAFGWDTEKDGPVTLIPLERRTKLKGLHVRRDCHVSSALEALGDFTSLEVLNLWNLGLESLPPSIWKLKKLKVLFISKNKLTSLPEEIGELLELKELECGYNRLTNLPRSLGRLSKLKSLKCYDNQLVGFPSSMGNLSPNLWVVCFGTKYFDNPLAPEYQFESWKQLHENLRNHPDNARVAARVLRAARAFSSRTCASSDSQSPFTLLPNDMMVAMLKFLDEERLLSEEDVRAIFQIGFERPRAMDREEFMRMLD